MGGEVKAAPFRVRVSLAPVMIRGDPAEIVERHRETV
jgi:hypothetical protein